MSDSLTNRLHKIIATAYLLCDAQPSVLTLQCLTSKAEYAILLAHT